MSDTIHDFKSVECVNCGADNIYIAIANEVNGEWYCDDCFEEYQEQLAQIIIESKF